MLIDELISYWKLDESSGDAIDIHSSNDAVETNGPIASVAGKLNGCRDLDKPSEQCFMASSNTELETGNIDWSVSFWINPESVGVGQDIIGKWGGSTLEWLVRYEHFFNTMEVYFNGAVQINHTITLSTGTWYHVVIWHDSVNDEVGIVVNNSAPHIESYAGGIMAGDSQLSFGKNPASAGTSFNGKMDEIGFWKKVLSSEEIGQLYNEGSALAYEEFGGGGSGEFSQPKFNLGLGIGA